MAAFDEMTLAGGAVRSGYQIIRRWLDETPRDLLAHRQAEAELLFRRIGITFAVYGESDGEERIIPFDIIPRILTKAEWKRLSAGLEQRVKALNLFLADIYGAGDIIRAGVVPADLIYRNPYFRPEMSGLKLPHDVYVHIAGIDIVRTAADEFYVLEDNARTPSGVSYMLENREVMMRVFPDLFAEHRIDPVETYPEELLATLKSVAPASAPADPTVALLTPGPYNSAYYEHSFLADKLGIELVEGRDLLVRDNVALMRTTEGPKRVDVLYRRLDDDFLDPLTFRPDSSLGLPGLMNVYRAGNITLANAVGTGVADDKAVYSYMPDIVRFYLAEEPILKNVPTWRCREDDARAYVLDHLHELVVKEVAGSGGYGMLIGPAADKATREIFAAKIKANPTDFIAQPTLALSTCPTVVDAGIAPRHVDLRPFVLTGADKVRIVPGGLTRVALKDGSLVVNSSQGGGTKDTWVLDECDMLSRTADSLFWLARYVERADNTARIIDAANRLTTLPLAYAGASNEWESALSTAGALGAFRREHPDAEADSQSVIDFLAFSSANSSSIKSCLATARANARAVRTALTAEMWEAINSAWLELKRYDGAKLDRPTLNEFLSRVKEACLRFDGSAYRTMLRNDAYFFLRLGVYLERADNTARILDVKYHVLLPEQETVGGGLDYFQWASILRSVSALTAYRWVYHESLKPWLIADLLVLNEQMPRSLASCYENLTSYLDELSLAYGRQGPAQRAARSMRNRLQNARIAEIFQKTGLHEFLSDFIDDNTRLGNVIADQYLI